jgi:hypothetical protein
MEAGWLKADGDSPPACVQINVSFIDPNRDRRSVFFMLAKQTQILVASEWLAALVAAACLAWVLGYCCVVVMAR